MYVFVCVYMCLFVLMCTCVCERERERERKGRCLCLCMYMNVIRFRKWCTEKNAWVVVLPVIILVALFKIAKTLDTELAFFNDFIGLNRFCRRLRECV